MTHEFCAVVGPDAVARVLYAREDSPSVGVICRSDLMHVAEDAAAAHNVAREEREALRAAGQGDLFG